MWEQAPGANLLHDSVSGASSLVCAEICFAGACFRSKLPHVYWLGYLPGSVFRECVSGACSFVCTGRSTYLGACFGSVFQEPAPSCVPALMADNARKCFILPKFGAKSFRIGIKDICKVSVSNFGTIRCLLRLKIIQKQEFVCVRAGSHVE